MSVQISSQNARPSVRIRLGVVGDKPLVCEGLKALFATVVDFDVVQMTASTDALLADPVATTLDVVLYDVTLDDPEYEVAHTPNNLLSQVRRLLERLPHVRIVLFDDAVREFRLLLGLRLGVFGYATKRDSLQELLDILRAAFRGERRVASSVPASIECTNRGWHVRLHSPSGGLRTLTAREVEVLALLAQGFTVRRCGECLGIAASTVDNHKARILRKLGVHKTIDLTRIALREGLISA